MYNNYAVLEEKDNRRGTEEIGYLTKKFRLGMFNYDSGMGDPIILMIENLHIATDTQMQLLELAHFVEAFVLGYTSKDENFQYLDCITVHAMTEGIPSLKFSIKYVEEFGSDPLQRDLVLSKTECYVLAKNIFHTIEKYNVQGRALLIST
jgi:hypothetical protein